MLPSTIAPSIQSFTTCPSAALAVPGWESITASGGSEHTRTRAAFCTTARGSTWTSATHRTTVTRCSEHLWSGHNRTIRLKACRSKRLPTEYDPPSKTLEGSGNRVHVQQGELRWVL